MQTEKSIRVIEIRRASNGWVLTAMEREGHPGNDYAPAVYKTVVAENVPNLLREVEALSEKDAWEQDVRIHPARRSY